jgi:hypothetical protein
MVGGVRCQGNSGSGGGSKRLFTEEAAEAWPAWQRRGGALGRSSGSEVRWSASTRCKEEQRRGVNGRRRRNEELLRQCAPIKATRGSGRWRRERWAGTTAAKPWARARWRPPLFEGAWRGLGTSVQTVRLTGGLHTVLIFF